MTRGWVSTSPLLLMLLVLALVIAACADEPEDDAAEADDEDVAEEEPAEDPAEDDDEEDDDEGGGPLEGESITFRVGYAPGGGYDGYARMIAPYLEEELGADDVTVENVDGAGGLLSVNEVYASPPDGTMLTIINGAGMIGSVLAEAEGVEFELDEFEYIGRLAGEPRVMNVNADSEYEDPQELVGFEEEFSFAASGPGAGNHTAASLLREALGMENSRLVAGFDGSEDANTAVTAGEVDSNVPTSNSALGAIGAGDHRGLLVIGEDERLEELPDVPLIDELEDLDEEQRRIGAALDALVESGRPVALPPDTPEEIVTAYREAFERIVEDEEVLEEAEQQDLPIAWRDAEQVEQIMQDALDSPDVVREILAEAEEEED